MNPSFFPEFAQRYFSPLVGKLTEKYNDRKAPAQLLHKMLLTEEYTVNNTWGASSFNNSIVAADIVSLNSSLPLKSRGSLGTASGELPKMGLKFAKDESFITNIRLMMAKGTSETEVAKKLMEDAARAIRAIDVRNEILFLQALSTGYSLTTDENNTGTGVRVDFGYKTENTLKPLVKKWSDTTATPIDDLQAVFDAATAKGQTLSHVWISRKYFNLLRASAQAKLLVASATQTPVADPKKLLVPSRAALLEALKDEFSASFHIVEATFQVENTDGTKKSISPWEEANVVFTPTDHVGRLVYGTLAEETAPVNGVNYAKSGSYVLVSKYSKNDPLEEFTSAQALCLPVIDGAEGIYILTADQDA